MSKRKKLKKYWDEKKGKIVSRGIRLGAIYLVTGLTGPSVALALNATELNTELAELAEAYGAIAKSCLGDQKFGFLPVPRSYIEGSLCVAMVLTCGVAAMNGFVSKPLDAACIGLMREVADKGKLSS